LQGCCKVVFESPTSTPSETLPGPCLSAGVGEGVVSVICFFLASERGGGGVESSSRITPFGSPGSLPIPSYLVSAIRGPLFTSSTRGMAIGFFGTTKPCTGSSLSFRRWVCGVCSCLPCTSGTIGSTMPYCSASTGLNVRMVPTPSTVNARAYTPQVMAKYRPVRRPPFCFVDSTNLSNIAVSPSGCDDFQPMVLRRGNSNQSRFSICKPIGAPPAAFVTSITLTTSP